MSANDVGLDGLAVHAFDIPTDGPDGVEADGTLTWDSTTIILVLAQGGGQTGLGYTYADISAAAFVESQLAPVVVGGDALAPATQWRRMFTQIRNAGRPGLGAMAISAVDVTLWDLEARLLGLPLVRALPSFRTQVPIYGSGGFTNYPLGRLADQLAGWVEHGIPAVKLKTSREPAEEPKRLSAVRGAIGSAAALFTDANGALTRKQAQAVDCLQADVTRCGGITGLVQVAGLAAGHQIDLSAHCAPAISAQAFCAVERLRHAEYFHDHVRVENLLFDGALLPREGALPPRARRPWPGP